MGENVRYDGASCLIDDPDFQRWKAEGRLVAICPEVAGGLAVPRPPCEIVQGYVQDKKGMDYTDAFTKGAKLAVGLVKKHQIKYALLKERSPSCGVHQIYDGSFTSQKIAGSGVCAHHLKEAGVHLFSEFDLETLKSYIST